MKICCLHNNVVHDCITFGTVKLISQSSFCPFVFPKRLRKCPSLSARLSFYNNGELNAGQELFQSWMKTEQCYWRKLVFHGDAKVLRPQ